MQKKKLQFKIQNLKYLYKLKNKCGEIVFKYNYKPKHYGVLCLQKTVKVKKNSEAVRTQTLSYYVIQEYKFIYFLQNTISISVSNI